MNWCTPFLYLLALAGGASAANAQCAGPGGAPFNCTPATTPSLSDLLLAGSKSGSQAGHTVSYTALQLILLDHSISPVTIGGTTQTLMQWLSGTGNASNLTSGTVPLARLPTIPASQLSGLAPSATTDTTNASNISSGTLPPARLPVPTATTLGGVQSAAAVAHQWVNSVSPSGVPALSQPAFTDISGNPSLGQVTGGLGYTPLAPANNLSDVGNAATARTNLGLGTAATANTGTSGATVPLLNGVNTWSGAQSFTTLSATGATNLGSPSVTPGTLNISGTVTNTQGSIISGQFAYTYPPTGTNYRHTYFYDTVTVPAGTTSGINESNWFGAEYTGSGTISGEINTLHCYQQYDTGLTMTDFNECEEVSGVNKTVGFGSHASYTSLFTNNAGATITGTIFALNISYTNNNSTTGSWANFVGIGCDANTGTGSAANTRACLENFDPGSYILSEGPAVFGAFASGGGGAILTVQGTSTSHFTFNTTLTNSTPTLVDYTMNDGALEIGSNGNDLASNSAMFTIKDTGGSAIYGTHIAIVQTAAPGITNATLDATASDVAGTLTLTAANPVLTFHVAYAHAPHCGISSPSGITGIASTSGITFTGGASGNTVTYSGCTQ